MTQLLRSGLAQRGWALHEIDELERMKRHRLPLGQRVFEGVVYWGILGVSIFANFVVSMILIPILLVVTQGYLLLALFFVGFVFGVLLETIIKETSGYHMSKLLIPELLIPAIALINIYIATQLSNRVAAMLLWENHIQNPMVTSVVYVTAFMLPHFWRKIRAHRHLDAVE